MLDDANETALNETEDESEAREPPKKPRGRSKNASGVEVLIKNKDFATIVSESIVALQDKLASMQIKPTLSEYLKLLELAKDLRIDAPRKEIQVQWIDPPQAWSDEE